MQIIDAKIKGSKTCSAAFKVLPGGRTFAEVWNDRSVWVSYDPGTTSQRYGATLGKEVTISAYSIRVGHWTVAATLIHELATCERSSGDQP